MDRHVPSSRPEYSRVYTENTVEKLSPDTITPDYLQHLVHTPNKKSLHGADGGPLLKIGDEHTTNEFNDPRIAKLLPRQHATVLIHDVGSLPMMSVTELTGVENLSIISPGIRQFLVTEHGIQEYVTPKGHTDVRDDLPADFDTMTEEEFRVFFDRYIRKNGWLRQEIKWEDKKEIDALVSQIRDALSTAKEETPLSKMLKQERSENKLKKVLRRLRIL